MKQLEKTIENKEKALEDKSTENDELNEEKKAL